MAAQRKLIGNEHPDLAQSLNRLATILRNEGKLAQSEAIRREALAMQRKLLGGENEEVAQTLSGLGDVLTEENRLSKAESMYRESLKFEGKCSAATVSIWAWDLRSQTWAKCLKRKANWKKPDNLYLQKTNGTSNLAATAQYRLAMMYQAGKGVEEIQSNLQNGSANPPNWAYRGAQCMMGIYYADGSGVPKDYVEAARWYRLAADRGHGMAQNNLGWVYQQGTGVPKDEVEAERWYRKSADQGNVSAMINLANLDGAVRPKQEAIVLLEKACEADPNNTDTSLTLAIWQTWFGHDADYEATRRRLVQQAEGTDRGLDGGARRQGCAACGLPPTPPCWRRLSTSRGEQWNSVKATSGCRGINWRLGLAEYRNGQYAAAERTLATHGGSGWRVSRDSRESRVCFAP